MVNSITYIDIIKHSYAIIPNDFFFKEKPMKNKNNSKIYEEVN